MNYAAIRAGLCAAALLLFVSGNAHAIFRAYFSSTGNDANPCTLQQPCRVLPAALAAVDNGGEIWMLDSANYNNSTTPVIITKSVTILAIPGALGSVIGIDSNDALFVNVPGGSVTLRNLVIRRVSGFQDGVFVSAAGRVSIENCVFSGFPPEGDLWLHAGIWVNTNAVVSVANSTLRDNAIGVFLGAGSTSSISNSQFVNNGIWVTNYTAGTTTRAAVSDSVVTGAFRGVYAWSTVAGANVRASVTRVVATGNDTAFILNGFAGSSLTVSGSTVTGNYWGLYHVTVDSIFRSTLDNIVTDNPSGDTTGVITPLAHM